MRPASPRSSLEPPTGVSQGRHLDLSPLWHAAWGLGRQPGPCASSSVTVRGTSAGVPEPLWAALCPQPRVSPHDAVTTGRVFGGSRDSVYGVLAWDEVGSPAPPFSSGGPIFISSFPDVWEAGSQIQDTVLPR